MYIKDTSFDIKMRNFQRSIGDLINKNMKELSTGLRINTASDDSAGLSISTRMKSMIRSTDMSMKNIENSRSMVQTIGGSLSSISDHLQRLRELTIQAQNGTNTVSDISSLQNEADKLIESLNNIAKNSSFNGLSLLNSSMGLKTDGLNSYAQLPTSSMSQTDFTTTGITGEAWIYWDGNKKGLELGPTPPQNEQFTSGIWGSNSNPNVSQMHFEIDNKALRIRLNNINLKVPNVIKEDELTNVAFTFDPNEGVNGMTHLFVNGEKVGSLAGNPGLLTLNQNKHTIGDSDSGQRSFNGYIQEFKLFGTARSEEEIKKDMYDDSEMTNLVGKWDFTTHSSTDTNVIDSSGNNNNGTIQNATYFNNNTKNDAFVAIHTGYEADNKLDFALPIVNGEFLKINNLQINDKNSLNVIDEAIDIVNDRQTEMGILENRLNFKLDGLNSLSINTKQSKLRIEEADLSISLSELTKEQIKLETTNSMILKRKEYEKSYLSLLQG